MKEKAFWEKFRPLFQLHTKYCERVENRVNQGTPDVFCLDNQSRAYAKSRYFSHSSLFGTRSMQQAVARAMLLCIVVTKYTLMLAQPSVTLH